MPRMLAAGMVCASGSAMKPANVCPKCRTSFAQPFDVCGFCGFHAHLRRGRICASCGTYVATAAEERALLRIEAECEMLEMAEAPDWYDPRDVLEPHSVFDHHDAAIGL